MSNPIKTASDLKAAVEKAGHESHFFTRSTMKCFGDTMKNYGVRQPVEVLTQTRGKVQAYELFRRKPVKGNHQESAWFEVGTFRRVFPQKEG